MSVASDDELPCFNDSAVSVWDDVSSTWFFLVITNSKTAGPRQPVVNWVNPTALTVYGSLLCVLALSLNAALCVVSLYRRQHLRGPRNSTVRRLLTVNYCAVQLVVALLVLPANVVTESIGRWTLGQQACRAWLVGQVLLIAATMWSLVAIVVDCLLRVVGPDSIYVHVTRHRPRLVVSTALVGCWFAAAVSTLPLAVSLGGAATGGSAGTDAILEDVCAVSLKRDDVLAQSVLAFLLPGSVALVANGIIVVAKLRRVVKPEVEKRRDVDDNDDDNEACTTRSDDSSSVVAISASCVALWCPFFALYILLPFCGDRLCIDPGAWTLFAWLGYSSVFVTSAFWLLDPTVRRQLCGLVARRRWGQGCCGCSGGGGGACPAGVQLPVETSSSRGCDVDEVSELIVDNGSTNSVKVASV